MTERSKGVFAYGPKENVDTRGFEPFDPFANGGSNLVGTNNMQVRVDVQQGNITAGIFMQEPCALDINWVFTEHSFVLRGSVKITDLNTGESKIYGPGEGWTIPKGSHTRWEVQCHDFMKSFFTVA